MSVTLADHLLHVRYVALLTVIIVALLIAPPLSVALRAPTVEFRSEFATLVTTDGELTVAWDPSAEDLIDIVVRRWRDDGTAEELGRAAVHLVDIDDASIFSSNDFVLVCGPANGAESHRFLFGAVVSRRMSPPHPATDLVSYFGPAATGARFPHDLYLVALTPGEIDPSTSVELLRTYRFDRRAARIFDEAARLGRVQASGCRVA